MGDDITTKWKQKINYNLFLFSIAAKAQLLGESAVYVKQGSTISLTCAINLYSEPPPDITWIHGSKVKEINLDQY